MTLVPVGLQSLPVEVGYFLRLFYSKLIQYVFKSYSMHWNFTLSRNVFLSSPTTFTMSSSLRRHFFRPSTSLVARWVMLLPLLLESTQRHSDTPYVTNLSWKPSKAT